MSTTKKLIDNANNVHRNSAQLSFALGKCQTNVVIAGRGTGKNTGIGNEFCYENIRVMPRSLGAFVGKSYEQILTSTLPPLIKGWEDYGLQRDVHFFIGKYAPSKYKIPKPFLKPEKANNIIHFSNGSAIQFLSQDKNSVAGNGRSCDWGFADEAKMLDHKRLIEEFVIPMRGNIGKFGHLYNHLSVLYMTDMPGDSSGDWLFELGEKSDPELIKGIMSLQLFPSHDPSFSLFIDAAIELILL